MEEQDTKNPDITGFSELPRMLLVLNLVEAAGDE